MGRPGVGCWWVLRGLRAEGADGRARRPAACCLAASAGAVRPARRLCAAVKTLANNLSAPRPAPPRPRQVAFTGHSLGGSLGTVLMMMYVRRGVLPPSAISPVYTFGAPAVFCEGAAGACACQAGGGQGAGAAADAGQGCGVLATLGLPEGAVR